MGKSKELYMEIAKVSMFRVDYDNLPKDIKDQMKLTSIDDQEEYPEDLYWYNYNRISSRAYRNKKNRAYDLRHGRAKIVKREIKKTD